MNTKIHEMEALINELRPAANAYYNENCEVMANLEYDQKFDRLAVLEKETGIVLGGSPTQFAGFPVTGKLEKATHEFPCLSLDKTKDKVELRDWLGDKEGVLSFKCDGCSLSATYDNGKLTKGLGRGQGKIGQVIRTSQYLRGLPQVIPYQGHLVVRGEALMSYEEFERINSLVPDTESKYKNPRNLASSTVQQQDPKVAADRNLQFVAFEMVYPDPVTYMEGMTFLHENGFCVVDRICVIKETLFDALSAFTESVDDFGWPVDGLVLTYNDIAYGKSIGATGHHALSGMAYKWEDGCMETTLREIFWSASRTGLLNPVAVFDTVDLEGTEVSRASVHNFSVIRQLQLGVGDKIMVFKANMIIPQISENLTKSNTAEIPSICPVCGAHTEIRRSNDTESVYCTNAFCAAKQVGSFVHFCCRDAFDVQGISENSLEKLIDAGIISRFADLFDIANHKSQICSMDGFGEKSYINMAAAIEKSRNVTLDRLIYSQGISTVGRDASKKISKDVHGCAEEWWDRMRREEHFDSLEGIGPVIDNSLFTWFYDLRDNVVPGAKENFETLCAKVTILAPEQQSSGLAGSTFVITGKVDHFTNRDALKKFIEDNGGRVAGSVSANTNYLINNDSTSASSKNKTAKSLGVSIITEEIFLKMMD